ncbi:hypothetical protein JCM11491_004588 [Sporobolomyces phaffii]
MAKRTAAAATATAAPPAEATTGTPLKKRKLSPAAESPADPSVDAHSRVLATTATSSKLDKGKAKKRRKELERALENPPSFSFDTRGFKGGRTIQVKDVRDFVLHLLANDKAQPWLFVKNRSNVQRVVALMVPGIVPTTLGIAQPPLSTNLPFSLAPTPLAAAPTTTTTEGEPLRPLLSNQVPTFAKLFSHACPTKAPGEKNRMHSGYQSFTTCPLTAGEKDRREKARKERGQKLKTSDPSAFLLTPSQMYEQNYPTPTTTAASTCTTAATTTTFEDWRRPEGWIEAPFVPLGESPNGGGPELRRVLGLDCEMCLTEDGSELARLSLVDQQGKSVYDKLVKPGKPITDYLTRFSGLTEDMLKDVTTTLEDVQRDLSQLIDHQTILLGHSLESDLKVLKLKHTYIIDTSVLYQHPRGPPFKASLKWLAQKWLKKEIQKTHVVPEGGVVAAAAPAPVGGHDSEEDARTCVELLNLKMDKGPGFGEFVTDQETIFERLARGQDPKTSVVVDHGTPGQWHGAKATTAVSCQNDDDVLQGVLDNVEQHDLTIARFMDLSHALGWSQTSASESTSNGAAAKGEGEGERDVSAAAYAALDRRLAALHAALPPLTALIIFTGHGDPRAMAELAAKKARFDHLWRTVKQSEIAPEDRWMEGDDRRLVDEVERCRFGLSFYCVKAS